MITLSSIRYNKGDFMNFDLELDNCFVMERNNSYSLVVDRDCIEDVSKVKVGTRIEFDQIFQTYKVKSVYYDSVNGIYVLGLEEL